MFELPGYVVSGLSFLTTLFVFVIGLMVAGINTGKSIPMDLLYPYPVPTPPHGAANARLSPNPVPGQA